MASEGLPLGGSQVCGVDQISPQGDQEWYVTSLVALSTIPVPSTLGPPVQDPLFVGMSVLVPPN